MLEGSVILSLKVCGSLEIPLQSRMNHQVYLRKKMAQQSRIIGFQNGQDASMVTMKNQARAQQPTQAFTNNTPLAVPTQFSKIGGTVGNIMEATQQTSSPTDQLCDSGYNGVVSGKKNIDNAASKVLSAQHCAICSDAPSSEPYTIVIPCGIFINPVAYSAPPQNLNAGTATATITPSAAIIDGSSVTFVPTTSPGTAPEKVCCIGDPSQLYRNNDELVADEGRQLAIRRAYNLPSKLQGLRGPIVIR